MRNVIEFLQFRARFDPDGVAILREGYPPFTFARFHTMVKATARMLREAGVRPGQLVVTALFDKGNDWTATLAAHHEAAITCSLGGYTPWRASFGYDWLITDKHWSGPRAPNVIYLDEQRLPREGLDDFAMKPYDSPDSVARIFLTSGTTGVSKGVPVTLRGIIGRGRHALTHNGSARALCLLGGSTPTQYNGAIASLMTGNPMYLFPKKNLAQLVDRHGVDVITGSPATLAPLVSQLVESGLRLEKLRSVRIVGTAAAPSLVRALHKHTAAQVSNLYGATETGGITSVLCKDTGLESAGYLQVGAELQIVDETGRVLPAGEEGTVRTRTPEIVSGYWKDDEATARHFKDGWFYPGDRGLLRQDGALVLSGRESEILNLGGVKVNPVAMEELIAEWPGVRDAGVFAARGRMGADRTMVCIAAEEGVDTEAISRALRERFGGASSPAGFIRVPEVPRNAMGKVRRNELAQRFAAGELKPA